MPKVWNRRDPNCPKDAVYVGRPSKWGNPYTHLSGETKAQFKVDTREQAIEAYKAWLALEHFPEIRAEIVRELGGKDLACWCAPQPCHADFLLEIANE